MEIIGLSGYARSGKDEAAKVLIEEFGFTRVAFADKLREVLYALNPIIMESQFQDQSRFTSTTTIYLQEVIDAHGWDGYKETVYGDEIRRLLQRLGTEAGREAMWDSIWIDAALKPYEGSNAKIVVTDCRFPNEAKAIFVRGGKVWRVKRTGVGPANAHPSETSLDDWPFDVVLYNDGSLEDYQETVRSTYNACRI